VFSALAHIHSLGIVHRDVKPENLFVKSDGCVLLGDFGLAGRVSARDGLLDRVCGTMTYRAPEIIAGARYGPAVDVWSAGITVYTLITGHDPWTTSAGEPRWVAVEKKTNVGFCCKLYFLYLLICGSLSHSKSMEYISEFLHHPPSFSFPQPRRAAVAHPVRQAEPVPAHGVERRQGLCARVRVPGPGAAADRGAGPAAPVGADRDRVLDARPAGQGQQRGVGVAKGRHVRTSCVYI
jgi:serine/threonine protein kinase